MTHPSRHHLDRLADEQARLEAIIEDLFGDVEDARRQVHQHGQRVRAVHTLASAWERGEPYSDPTVAELFPEPQAPQPKRPKRRPGGPRRLRWRQVCEIRRLSRAGVKQSQLAERFSVSASLISKIVSGRTWQNPPPNDAADDIGRWRCVS